MHSRTFKPVMTLITTMLMLFGLASGCVSDSTTTDPNPIAEVDTTTTTDTAIAQPDQATQDQIDQGIRFDSWVTAMDPFVTENQNWTYTFDNTAFLASITATHPEVVAYYEGSGSATEDTVVIDVLIAGFDIVNPYALEQYNELTANGTIAPPPSVYGAWYWWGYKRSYTGSDSDAMIALMNTGSASLFFSGIGTVPAATLALMAGIAGYYDAYYGGFCINVYWTTNISIGRPG